MIIVSACLAGINSRYDGRDKKKEEIIELVKEGKAVPLCPELLGGLRVPRGPAEIETGDGRDILKKSTRVVNARGEDITREYLEGANQVLKMAQVLGCEEAILLEGSPSCGVNYIRRGGEKVPGPGVSSALLLLHGISVTGLE
jgi:uncharacterized protein YbbK (DUF523 family)